MARVVICGNCKHWQRPKEIPVKNTGVTKSNVKYQCRRYPPVPFAGISDSFWPKTGYYWHCGEFMKRRLG